jgi:hypothetical protein
VVNYYQSAYYRACDFCVSLQAQIFYDDQNFTATTQPDNVFNRSYSRYDFTVTGANVFLSTDQRATWTPVNTVFTGGSFWMASYIQNAYSSSSVDTSRRIFTSTLYFSGGSEILPGLTLAEIAFTTLGGVRDVGFRPLVVSDGRLKFELPSTREVDAGASIYLRDATGSESVNQVSYFTQGSQVEVITKSDLATFQRTLFFLPPNDCSNSTGL